MVHFLLYGFVSHEVSKELARQRSDAADAVVAITPLPEYQFFGNKGECSTACGSSDE